MNKLLTVPAIYIFESLKFLVNQPSYFEKHHKTHEYGIRFRNDFLYHLSAEMSIFCDFNVYNIKGLKFSNINDEQSREVDAFAIRRGLTQNINEPTRIPDRDGEYANLLDLYLTTNPKIYTVTVRSPLGSSDHKLISILSELSINVGEQSKRKVWHYRSVKWGDLQDHFRNLAWLDVCSSPNVRNHTLKGKTSLILSSHKFRLLRVVVRRGATAG